MVWCGVGVGVAGVETGGVLGVEGGLEVETAWAWEALAGRLELDCAAFAKVDCGWLGPVPRILP